MKRLAAALLTLALAACLPASDIEGGEGPDLDPIQFFEGDTSGKGTLTLVTGATRPIRVVSIGERAPDGSLMLVQRITEGDKPPRTRTWIMTEEGYGRYGGSLTDAVGAIKAEVTGNHMRIAYETDGERIEQLLVRTDENTIRNRLDAYKWGLNVARLDETIVRND